MPTSDLILWLDLETTGNGPDDDIIEVGATLTDRQFVLVASFQRVYRAKRAISDIAPAVLAMHFDNGLWNATTQAKYYATDQESQAELLEWLGKAGALKGGASSLPLAGSGTSHFDRRYIERDWPKLANRLTFWNLDIGVVRRFMRSWLTPEQWLEVFPEYDEAVDPKQHRALGDTLAHIREAKRFKNLVQMLLKAQDGQAQA